MAKSNYFSNTHALQTRRTIDGVRSSVAYCSKVGMFGRHERSDALPAKPARIEARF